MDTKLAEKGHQDIRGGQQRRAAGSAPPFNPPASGGRPPARESVRGKSSVSFLYGLKPTTLAAAVACGALAAFIALLIWSPSLVGAMFGSGPKAYWYLSRSTGIVSFVLIWVSMASGLLISNKMARIWPGAFTAFDLHQYTSLLGLGFGVFHAVALLGQEYLGYSVLQILVPFVDAPYRPVWVGMGQISIYLLVLVSFTFYIRKQLGTRLWRGIHLTSYAIFAMVLLHGVASGTDSSNPLVLWMYWLAGVSLGVLSIYRLVVEQKKQTAAASNGSAGRA